MLVITGNTVINIDHVTGIYLESKPNTSNCEVIFNCVNNMNYKVKYSNEKTASKAINMVLGAYGNKEDVCFLYGS